MHDRAGKIRLIDASVASCKHNERQIAWNVAGQPGEPGAPGSGGAAIYTKWDGAIEEPGEVEYLANEAVTSLVTLAVPDGFDSGSVVVTATVWITNWLDQSVWGGCGVWRDSDDGGPWLAGWPFTLPHGYNLLSFQVELTTGSGPLELRCSLNPIGDQGNPDANGQVWAQAASLGAVPAATP